MDTTADAARLQRAVLGRKTGEERALMAVEMSELVRQIALDGIRHRSPDIGSEELMSRLIGELHGPALAKAVAHARSASVAGGH